MDERHPGLLLDRLLPGSRPQLVHPTTSSYPVQPGTAMISQAGDFGVTQYVAQTQADGAIGFVAYSNAIEIGFPVAKVLNAAGYYTAPTAGMSECRCSTRRSTATRATRST